MNGALGGLLSIFEYLKLVGMYIGRLSLLYDLGHALICRVRYVNFVRRQGIKKH